MNTEVILIILVVLLGIVNAVVVVCFISFWRKQAQLQASLSDSHLLEAYTREFSRIAESWNKTAETWNELGKAGAKVGGNFQTFDALLSAQLRSVEQLDLVIQKIDELLSVEMEGKKHQKDFWSDIFHRVEYLIDESRERIDHLLLEVRELRMTFRSQLEKSEKTFQNNLNLSRTTSGILKEIADKIYENDIQERFIKEKSDKDDLHKEDPEISKQTYIPFVVTSSADKNSDCVQCSVFAPSHVSPGESFLVQVFAYFRKEYITVCELAQEFDDQTKELGFKYLATKIKRGTELMFDLDLPSLNIDNPVEILIWNGQSESVQFAVNIPEKHKEQNIIGKLTIIQNSIPIGHIRFKLSITQNRKTSRNENVGEESKRYNRAFISYAHEDINEVISKVQMLDQLSISFYQDILKLKPGERWEQKLYKLIDDCDVFFLFWSKNAKKSEWVRKEANYALGRKRGVDENPPEIKPVIIEKHPLEPWEELNHLHFNDALIYFKN